MPSDPFNHLENDHRVIELVLGALERADAEYVDASFYQDVIGFVQDFADGIHHEYEESHLFPALEAAGVMRHMGPIGVMLEEHVQARASIARLGTHVEAGDLKAACAEGRAYAALLRDHIHKEEHALFMVGRSVLSEETAAELADRFARTPTQGPDSQSYESAARSIARRAG